jgi:O-antigen/teichoic acid export membrane protein
VGYYSIAVVIAEKIWYIPTVFSLVLYPRVAHGGEEGANSDTARVCRQTILIILFCCAGVLVAGRYAIEVLYSRAFSPAAGPLLVLLPGIVTAGISRIIASDLMARGHPGVILSSGLAAFVTNVALNLIFIPRMGITGAALATDFSYLVNAVVLTAAFLRISGLAAGEVLIPRIEDLRIFLSGLKRITTGEAWRR